MRSSSRAIVLALLTLRALGAETAVDVDGERVLWPACQANWARPTETPVPLTANEMYRVRRYLGDALAPGAAIDWAAPPAADGAPRAALDLERRCGRRPCVCGSDVLDPLIRPRPEDPEWLRTRDVVRFCRAAATARLNLDEAHQLGDLRCFLHAYEGSAYGRRLSKPDFDALRWSYAIGDFLEPLRGVFLAKARVLAKERPDYPSPVILPLQQARHGGPLQLVQRHERAKRALRGARGYRPFEARQRCAVWRGSATGRAVRTSQIRRAIEDVREGRPLPGAFNTRVALVLRYARAYQLGGVRVDVGLTPGTKGLLQQYVKLKIPVLRQLVCKYLLQGRGNDVATGLKWMLYTDSVVLMPPPTFESWALEGDLRPMVHYIPVREDWSDLAEKLAWAEAHPARAKNISAAATAHVQRVFGGGVASERRVVLATLHAYRQALAQFNERG